MIRLLLRPLLSLLLLLLPTACVSTEPQGANDPANKGVATAGVPPPGLAFDYVLDHGARTAPMRQCFVRFSKLGGGATVEARLLPNAEKILVKVPVGSYKLLDASCDNGKKFTLPPVEAITIEAEKVTYLGEVRLVQGMASKTQEKDTLQIDDRDTEKSRDSLADLKRRGLAVVIYKKTGKKPTP